VKPTGSHLGAKKGSGIIVSKLKQPDQELMKKFGVKALFEVTQVSTKRLPELTQWVNDKHVGVKCGQDV
jgi:hypothetical protein